MPLFSLHRNGLGDMDKTKSLTKKKSRPLEFLIEKSFGALASMSIIFIILICVFIFREASRVFSAQTVQTVASQSTAAAAPEEAMDTYGEESAPLKAEFSPIEENVHAKPFSFRDLFDTVWQPVSLIPKFGLWPLILGSLKVALIAILIATPIAVLSAIYTSMFASKWVKEIMKPCIEILAGFPSVVLGFFALVVLATTIQNIFGQQYRLNAFTGGVALSLAVIPLIFTITDDSLSAVPRSLIEASLSLGASEWETVFFVVLPAALPGIFAAILLGIGRAIGETMIVLMATGNAAISSWSMLDPVRTMSATIGAEMAEVVFGDIHYCVLFIVGSFLFVVSFLLNFIAEVFIRDRLMKRFRGA